MKYDENSLDSAKFFLIKWIFVIFHEIKIGISWKLLGIFKNGLKWHKLYNFEKKKFFFYPNANIYIYISTIQYAQ